MEQTKSIKTFRDLLVWQKSHALVLKIYSVIQNFPSNERFIITSQLQRAVLSVPTNIVEGYNRKTRKEYLYFLSIAFGSLEEVKYHLIVCKDLGYLTTDKYEDLMASAEEIGRMLYGLQKKLSS